MEYLDIQLPPGQSAFLWGARNTGKSTYLHQRYPHARYYDLLQTDILHKLLVAPQVLREELQAIAPEKLHQPVIIDEVQKIPILLDEIHWLIENKKISFILCGSSARKLKRGAANLLGGRAWGFNFYPLIYKEIPDFNLYRALNHGLLPSHYLSDYPERSLRAYINNYLKEEIQELSDLAGLSAFCEDYHPKHALVICLTKQKRKLQTKGGRFIDILPWQEFLDNLWDKCYL